MEKHSGVHTSLSEDVSQLLKLMASASWVGSHSCASKNDCVFCESSVMWHQLALQLIEFLAPDHPVNPPDVSNLCLLRMMPQSIFFNSLHNSHSLLSAAGITFVTNSACAEGRVSNLIYGTYGEGREV